MQQRFRVEVVTTAEKNDDCIESNEQLDKCERFDVREDSTVGVKIAELLRLNVSTSIDEQFSLKVQKTAEVLRTKFIDRVVNIRSCNSGRSSSSCAEDRGDYTSAVLDKVVDMSVVVQRQVPMVQVVQKTVGHEESQSACMIATGGVAAYQLISTAWN